ncbi:hypothetical protein [Bradyrhizobium sp. RDM4]|uniref:hypothetical protein n=1 Tax=Bradyrhizobium sp. RDM4 TaxID=3378765 RepID=UPI0038FC98D9
MTSDTIPIVCTYRGVGLHDQQSPARLDVVRAAIDDVFDQGDIARLFDIAGDASWPPEARLLAAAKLAAMVEIAVDERAVRPPIDLTLVQAIVAGLDSVKWRHPQYFASLFDAGPAPGVKWPERRSDCDEGPHGHGVSGLIPDTGADRCCPEICALAKLHRGSGILTCPEDAGRSRRTFD